MARTRAVSGLLAQWAVYLQQRGHRVALSGTSEAVVTSRGGRGPRYRWLLFHTARATRRLTPSERELIQRQLTLGRRHRQRVYVVTKFERPDPKLVLVPAAEAANARWLVSVKGGIVWED